MKYVLLFCCCLGSLLLFAQEQDAAEPVFVEGPVYKVINAADGPVILWAGQPAAAGQVINSAPDLLTVYPPNSTDARLLVYLRPDGRLQEVIDLEYEEDPRLKTGAESAATQELLTTEPIIVNFRNGLVFTYENGEATAYYEGEFLPVSGEKGRYRIKTKTFEAGVAFGAPGDRVYEYLKEL